MFYHILINFLCEKNIGPLFGTDVRHPRTTLPELAYEWVYIVE